ncbi:MAG: hypothetical protein Q7R52_04935 [archaeon]|nr:hypothetical protein [archaeon]
MDYTRFGNKSLIGEFVEAYVKIAFELAKRELSQSDFDSKLIDAVTKDSGLAREVVLGLHHPFHWAFFLSGNGSPFKFENPVKLGEQTLVKLSKKEYSNLEREEIILGMSNKILDDYGNLLIAKRKRLQLELGC